MLINCIELRINVEKLFPICSSFNECISRLISVPLFIAEMSNEKDNEIELFCNKENIPYWDATLDINREGYRNLPYDYHPSAIAHKEYANSLLSNFREAGLLEKSESTLVN